MLEDYRRAHKRATKEFQADVAAGRYPYPPALDDILKGEGYQGEIPLGLAEIDLSLIAGTRTRGRQNSFSSGFMPLQEASTEFASKWSDLIDSQRAEGIHEPIVVYEYLQRFYVQEGNKRVSVLRYLGQPTVLAKITRVVPMPSDSKAYRVYQEFMRFYRVAPVFGIVLAEEGDYARLAAFAGRDLDNSWPDDAVRDLRSAFDAFAAAFRARHGETLGMSAGSAFLIYLKVFGYDEAVHALPAEVDARVARIWDEFVVSRDGGKVAYLEDPSGKRTNIIPEIKSLAKETMGSRPFFAAFIYESSSEVDGWTALHEKGRMKLVEKVGPTVMSQAYFDCNNDAAFDAAVADATRRRADLIVTVSPTQMRSCLRAAVAHPEVPIINCSVSLSHSAVRTFAGRLYEAKFLLGALAASMAKNHRVGYVAENPVYGTVAEINAFAIGARMIDPYVTVYLKWFSAKDYDWKRELAESDVRVVSARDYLDPSDPDEPWGLYEIMDDGTCRHLAEPIWKWGRYYALIVRSIRNDSWKKEGATRRGEALNYWWGMSAGVLDVRLSDEVPYGQRVLVEGIRQSILTRRINPFAGELVSQGGTLVHTGPDRLSSEEIVRMRWLNENIVGRLPEQRELSQEGLEQVEVSGVIPLDPTKLPHKGTLS